MHTKIKFSNTNSNCFHPSFYSCQFCDLNRGHVSPAHTVNSMNERHCKTKHLDRRCMNKYQEAATKDKSKMSKNSKRATTLYPRHRLEFHCDSLTHSLTRAHAHAHTHVYIIYMNTKANISQCLNSAIQSTVYN
jgi:hypothetical protein